MIGPDTYLQHSLTSPGLMRSCPPALLLFSPMMIFSISWISLISRNMLLIFAAGRYFLKSSLTLILSARFFPMVLKKLFMVLLREATLFTGWGGRVAPEFLITLANHLIYAKDFLRVPFFTNGFRKY